MKCVRMRRCVDDDWELYEQAALQREMESDTEEQDNESSGSTESLPTFYFELIILLQGRCSLQNSGTALK